MKIELGKENIEAEALLPPHKPDGSKIGVNYANAYIKAIQADLGDGGKVQCKRRGIKLMLTVGEKTGEGLMRRFVHGPDPKRILREALKEAASGVGADFSVDDGMMILTTASD